MAKQAGGEMPFLDHLEELRWRLIKALGALAVGIVVAFVTLLRVDVIGVLQRPIAPLLEGEQLVFTHPGDPFGIIMKAAFAIGFILALPVILYQAWAFLAPALYEREKKVMMPALAGAVALFAAGVALSYFVVLPYTLRFLLGFQTESLRPMITAGDYFGFAISMSLAFGAVFELPILVVGLTALGIVTPQFLRRFRRHAIIICVVASAFIVPGADVMSLSAMAVPMYFLYELSILLSQIVYRRRERRALEADGPPGREATA
ncbi:MAG: twin-arginine translocase subunit TatC [Gemmatimonadaceae bacterium]